MKNTKPSIQTLTWPRDCAQLISESLNDFNSDQTVVFESNYHDADFVQSISSGVAVDNALPEIKALAKETALHQAGRTKLGDQILLAAEYLSGNQTLGAQKEALPH